MKMAQTYSHLEYWFSEVVETLHYYVGVLHSSRMPLILTILGSSDRIARENETVPLPSGKTTRTYAEEVLLAVKTAAQKYNVSQCVPLKIMADFELGA